MIRIFIGLRLLLHTYHVLKHRPIKSPSDDKNTLLLKADPSRSASRSQYSNGYEQTPLMNIYRYMQIYRDRY